MAAPQRGRLTVRDPRFMATAACCVATAGTPCDQVAASWWVAGCPHEHVTPGIGICRLHERAALQATWDCSPCAGAARQHQCAATLQPELAAPATRKEARHDRA
jgi:hypothetical protein